MSEIKSLYLKAIFKEPVERTPVWIMRQAGRYLPEYQEVRSKHDFLTVCKTPELATEVTLQPIRRFGFDAAILFSDILVIPEALGQTLQFMENHGPMLSPQLLTEREFNLLSAEDLPAKLSFVAQAIAMIRPALPKSTPLIGFSGSPFTLATYMIEGKPTRNFKYIKTMLYSNPELLERLLELLSDAVSTYLQMQIRAGAQAIQIFDTWGAILPIHLYRRYSAHYMKKIVQQLKPFKVPVTLFSRGGLSHLLQLEDSGAAMVGVDWLTDLAEAKQYLGGIVALQGNLDPTALYGSREIIKQEVDKILDVFGSQSGHVFNLGHGILPDIPVDNVYFLVDYIRQRSSTLHAQQ